MDAIDLDIENYDIPDLERFFRIDTSVFYDAADIELKEAEIRNILLSSGHIKKNVKRDLIMFLEKAKQLLIDNIAKKEKTTAKHTFQTPIRDETIIKTSQKQVIYTQDTSYVPGIVNPIDRRTLSRCISIDTRFRQNPYQTSSSDFTLTIPNKINKVVSIQCNSFEIVSRGIPNISSSLGNNYLYVSITAIDGKEFNNIFILPTGHYNQTLLIETFNDLFSKQKHSPFLFLEMIIDPLNSGKVILYINEEKPEYSEQIKYISLDFTLNQFGEKDKSADFVSKIGRLLGFTKHKYHGLTSYISETILNPYLCIPYFYLALEDFQNRSSHSFEPAYSNISTPQSIIARIVPQKVKEEEDAIIQSLKIISLPRKYFGPVDLNRFQIRLLDLYGQIIDMNYNDYSFCLLIETIYEN